MGLKSIIHSKLSHYWNPDSLRVLLPYAFFAVYTWFIYGVLRRMSGSSGDSLNRRYRDFLEFYSAAVAMLKGSDIYASGYLGYIYPPLLAFLMSPLGMLSIAQAACVWLIIKIVLLTACGLLGAGEIRRRFAQSGDWLSLTTVFLLGMLINIDKLRTEMNMQQSNLLVLLCFVSALQWLDRRPLLSGLALGFGANIKYLTLIALPYLLFRKRFKAAAATVAGSLFWALSPAPFIGWDRNLEFLGKAVGGLVNLASKNTAASGSAKVYGPKFGISIPAFAAKYAGGDGHTVTSVGLVCIIALLFSAAVYGIYRSAKIPMFSGRGGPSETMGIFPGVVALEWSGLIIIALAFSPQTNNPHLSMLLLPCMASVSVLLMPGRDVPGRPLVLGLFIMVACLSLPPGNMGFDETVHLWRSMAGPVWGILIMYLTLLHVGLGRLKLQNRAAKPE